MACPTAPDHKPVAALQFGTASAFAAEHGLSDESLQISREQLELNKEIRDNGEETEGV